MTSWPARSWRASSPGPSSGSRTPRDLLRRSDFRRLYVARLTSQLADGVFEASLAGFVVFNPDRAPDASTIAGSLAAVLLPFTVVGPFAGIALDRLSRQRVLLAGALARAALCLGAAGLMAGGHHGPDLFVVAIAVLSVSRFVLSALSAAMPLTLHRPDAAALVTAGSLSTTSGTVTSLAGAGLGTGVRSLAGTGDGDLAVVAVCAAAAYLVAAAAARRCGRRSLGPLDPPPSDRWGAEVRRAAGEVADGARHLWQAHQARNALLAVSAHRLAYGLTFVATILLYRSYFNHGQGAGDLGGLGTLVAFTGLGTLAAALVTPRATRRWGRHRWVTANLLSAAAGEVAFGLPFRPGLLLGAGLVLGFVAQSIKLSCDSLVQEEIDDAYRGRAFSSYDLALNLCYVGAAGIGALLLPRDGHSPSTLLLAAGLYLAAGVTFARSGHEARQRDR